MFIITYRKIFFALSAALIGVSLFSMVFFGLNLGIDFTGGSITEVSYVEERPAIEDVRAVIAERTEIEDVVVQATGEHGYIIRTRELGTPAREALFAALSFDGAYTVTEERYNLVGPSIGEELKRKAWIAIVGVLLGIILFVAFVFRRHVERDDQGEVLHDERNVGVSSWNYSLAAIIALAHDIIIPTGIFALLGMLFIDAQIDVLFVTALLAILGYSVNDTIVVFDRVRENLRYNHENNIKQEFGDTVGKSLEQTFTRSINTSLTTLAVLGTLFFLGGEVTQNFALVLAIGVLAGTYSSLFLATPLLVEVERWNRRKTSVGAK